MEEKILWYIHKLNTDKIRLTELIAYFTHDVSGSDKETVIYNKILPALIKMEKDRKIKLSWDVMLTRYRFPRYVYFSSSDSDEGKQDTTTVPLWQKQVENILKRNEAICLRKRHELQIQDKFDRFIQRYEKSSEEIQPSDDWIKVITAIMETNLSQYDVMHACIEAFKAGAIWERYHNEFEE